MGKGKEALASRPLTKEEEEQIMTDMMMGLLLLSLTKEEEQIMTDMMMIGLLLLFKTFLVEWMSDTCNCFQ